MKTITTIEGLRDVLEKDGYTYHGFRNATEHDLELVADGRDHLDCSYKYVDGNKTDEQFDGTCAIGVFNPMVNSVIIKRYEHAIKYYDGNTVLLLGDKCGKRVTQGECSEWILGGNGYGANVIAYVKL